MIVDLIVSVALGILKGLLSLVPVWSPTSAPPDGFVTMNHYLTMANALLPIDTMLTVLAAGLAFKLALMVWDLAVWVWDKLPFKAS